jgi:hypothetical protein
MYPLTRRGRAQAYLPRALSWCAARLRGAELDPILAEGLEPDARRTDPVSRQRCEARAQLLVRRSFRRALASEIEGVLAFAADFTAKGAPSTVSAVDVQLDELREATPSLRLIVAGLEEPTPPRAQGVALALLLLRDGRSPLYGSRAPGELKLAAQATALALASPVSWARGLGSARTAAAPCWWREPAAAPTRSAQEGLEGDA